MKGKKECPEGMGSRVSVSILSFFGLLSFVVVWFFFYADSYSLYQNIAVVIVALLLFLAVNGAVWAPWGMKHGEWEEYHKKKPGKKP